MAGGDLPYVAPRIPLDDGLRDFPVVASGPFLQVLAVPREANAQLRLGSTNADPLPLDSALECDNCDQFEKLYLDADPVPGGFIWLYIGVQVKLRGVQASEISLGLVEIAGSTSVTAAEGTAPSTAAALGSESGLRELLLQCKHDSPESIFVGDASLQPLELEPGDSLPGAFANSGAIYIKSPTGAGTYALLTR